MLNIIAEALLIAVRMDPPRKESPQRHLAPETARPWSLMTEVRF